LKAIIGIGIEIDRLEGKWKVSQNRPEADRLGVAEGLSEKHGDDAMAELVIESRPRRPILTDNQSVSSMKSAVAIRHVHFEDLGTLGPVLRGAEYTITYLDVGIDDLMTLDPLRPDLLVVLGAPVGVYESEAYPFLLTERELLVARLRANLPTLGICLGGQQIATALGAKVRPGGFKEIGFSQLDLTDAGRKSPLRHFEGVTVLHWHGDVFDIPDGAVRLAATALCQNQAFSVGRNVLALQFHPEVDTSRGLEAWLIGHAAELAAAKIDPRTIRADVLGLGRQMLDASRAMFSDWLGLHIQNLAAQ
jgi:GMP synthase (glutamine-hydrolysing)